MSRFYQTTERDARTRVITARAHGRLTSHLRGWTPGVEVILEHEKDGTEKITVRRTSGSTGAGGQKELVAEFDTAGGHVLYARPDYRSTASPVAYDASTPRKRGSP